MIINQRTVKYLLLLADYFTRTSQRISVTDIESLNATDRNECFAYGLGHGMSLKNLYPRGRTTRRLGHG